MAKHNYPPTRADTGPRPNAGRKPFNSPVRVTVTLEEPEAEWLKAQGNVSKALRELVKKAMDNEPNT